MVSDGDNALAGELRRKLQEGLKAHSIGAGFPLVGGAFEQAILTRAENELSGLSPAQVAAMSLTSEKLVVAVASSFNTAISQLAEPQRAALRAGFDPFSPAVLLAASTPVGIARLLSGRAGELLDDSGESRSGQRFATLRGGDANRTARGSLAGLDSDTVALFKATGLSQTVFDDLSQRFTLNQIRQAAGFAGELGVRADAYAGKFAGLDQESRADLRGFVGGMRDDPGMPEDEKRRQIAAFRASHPKLRSLSDADLLNIVNARQLDAVHDVGTDAARALSTAEVLPANSQRHAASANGSVSANARKEASALGDAAVVAAMDDALGVGAAGGESPPRKAPRHGAAPHPKA